MTSFDETPQSVISQSHPTRNRGGIDTEARKIDDNEASEENNVDDSDETGALSVALSLRKRRRLDSILVPGAQKKPQPKRTAAAAGSTDTISASNEGSENPVAAVYGRFLPAATVTISEAKNEPGATSNLPASLPKKPIVTNISQNGKTRKNQGGDNTKNKIQIRPRGLLSTDDEVKGFAVSGRIVEVSLQNKHGKNSENSAQGPGSIDVTKSKITKEQKRVAGSEVASRDTKSSTNVDVAKPTDYDAIINQSVETIFKTAAPSFLALTYSNRTRNYQNSSTKSNDQTNQSNHSRSNRRSDETDEDRRRRLRIEQARRMHEDIERSMRLRDQRSVSNRRGGGSTGPGRGGSSNNNKRGGSTVGGASRRGGMPARPNATKR